MSNDECEVRKGEDENYASTFRARAGRGEEKNATKEELK